MNDKKGKKGKKGGLCNRAACLAPGAEYFNYSTRKFYCEKCAGLINKANPEFLEEEGHELCVIRKPKKAEALEVGDKVEIESLKNTETGESFKGDVVAASVTGNGPTETEDFIAPPYGFAPIKKVSAEEFAEMYPAHVGFDLAKPEKDETKILQATADPAKGAVKIDGLRGDFSKGKMRNAPCLCGSGKKFKKCCFELF